MRILIAVDGSDYSCRAVEFIASRQTLINSNPAIEALYVQSPLPASPARVVGKKVVNDYYAVEADRVLKPVRQRLQDAGLNPIAQFAVGKPAIEISARADDNNVDLLVLGSHGHTALGGLLLGSVAAEVLVRTKRALLIVRGAVTTYADSLRVGIAVDGSRYGQEAAKYVSKHLKLFGANPQLTLIHVVQNYLLTLPPTSGIAQPAFSDSQVRELQDKAFDDAVEPARALLRKRPGCSAYEVRLVGNAAEELSAYAKTKLDLLVLGSHGYGAFRAAMMGSVATRVTAQSKVPLLLVRA